jgi:hypothetical protein
MFARLRSGNPFGLPGTGRSQQPAADLRAGIFGLLRLDQALGSVPVQFGQLVTIDGDLSGTVSRRYFGGSGEGQNEDCRNGRRQSCEDDP